MKRVTIYIFIFSIILSGLVSCDIDRFPETEISDGNYWNSESDLELAANYFYTTLPGLTSGDIGQLAWGASAYNNKSPNSISDGSRVAPTSDDAYGYSNIFQTNNLIEKASEVVENGVEQEVADWYVAEAKFFRAWYYFEKLKRYGGVPIITQTLDIEDEEVYKERSSRDEVLDLIYEDLDFAIDKLREDKDVDYGRISKTAALAFKSRVALFEETRSKFHNYGDADKHLKLAKEAAEEVINSGVYAIYSTPETGSDGRKLNDAYFNLFQEEGERNAENIIVRIYGEDDSNQISSTPVQRYLEGDVGPTNNFVQNYLMVDGLPIEKSSLFKKPTSSMTHAEFFEGRDPRMDFSILKRGDEHISTSDYTVPSPTNERTGYGIRKYANKTFWARQRSYIDRPVLRYAEVLLNFIEAKYELEGEVSDDDLDATINVLRARLPEVNTGTASSPKYEALPALSNSFVNSNGLKMRDEIRRERLVELAFEGFEYWDLIRWKTAETEMSKSLKGVYLFSELIENGWSASAKVDEKNYIIMQDASLRSFNPDRDYLWPIPTNEIAKNPKIEQNPGW